MSAKINDKLVVFCITITVLVTITRASPYTTSFAPPIYQQIQQEQQHSYLSLDAPQVFPTTESPLENPQKTQEYRNFLSELYRFDKDKDPQTFQTHSQLVQQPQYNQYQYDNNPYVQGDSLTSSLPSASSSPSANYLFPQRHMQKRAIIFRPLFVYKQQVVKRQKLEEERRREQQPQRPQQSQQQHYGNQF